MTAVKLSQTIDLALPLLMRERVIEAILRVQTQYGEPVTAQEVRDAQEQPLMRHTRALTEIAHKISALGPDEQGRRLQCAGKKRTGILLWWVVEPKRAADRRAPRRAAKKAAKKATRSGVKKVLAKKAAQQKPVKKLARA